MAKKKTPKTPPKRKRRDPADTAPARTALVALAACDAAKNAGVREADMMADGTLTALAASVLLCMIDKGASREDEDEIKDLFVDLLNEVVPMVAQALPAFVGCFLRADSELARQDAARKEAAHDHD